MGLIRDKESKRLHIESKLMGESLVSHSFLDSLEIRDQFKIFPEVNVMKIGGQSITDRGGSTLLPIIKEIAENSEREKMVILAGGGTRSRHVYSIALELGMPTGVIAELGSSISTQNALMISTLLGPYGGIQVEQDDIIKLALYIRQGCIPVMEGMPPYGFWEKPPKEGRIPSNRTDIGTFLAADLIGAKNCIYIKDVDGLYTHDPKKDPNVDFIPKVGAKELLDMDLDDMIIERAVLESMLYAQGIDKLQIINGTKYGNITRALRGEHVGTIIYKDV